jgi:hypothetical protein
MSNVVADYAASLCHSEEQSDQESLSSSKNLKGTCHSEAPVFAEPGSPAILVFGLMGWEESAPLHLIDRYAPLAPHQ